jgi:hypothetical protein
MPASSTASLLRSTGAGSRHDTSRTAATFRREDIEGRSNEQPRRYSGVVGELPVGAGRAAEDRPDVVAEPSGVAARDQGEGLGVHLRDGAGTPSSCAGTAGLTRMTDVTASVAASAEAVTSRSPTAVSGPTRHGEAGHRADLLKGTAKAVRDSFLPRRPAAASSAASSAPRSWSWSWGRQWSPGIPAASTSCGESPSPCAPPPLLSPSGSPLDASPPRPTSRFR